MFFKWLVALRAYNALPNVSNVPNEVPTIRELPDYANVIINFADDCIYRNVGGEIVRYTPEKPKCAVLTLIGKTK